ncbi:MAG: HAD hydrolase family protein [Coriobacteriales bacterium]|jgi:hydroxymethylpyrimidine pyrophosphatase-like HAD family hydrolase|nr:HAD hydrolase family protein [Coriobacteriales bacterium]
MNNDAQTNAAGSADRAVADSVSGSTTSATGPASGGPTVAVGSAPGHTPVGSTGDLYSLDSPCAHEALLAVTHVYTDLDGTMLAPGGRLLTRHDTSPSVACAQALVDLKRVGVEVIVVTGRSRAQGTEIMRLLDLDHFIGELGCVEQKGFGQTAQISYNLGRWPQDWHSRFAAHGSNDCSVGNPDRITPYQLIAQSGIVELLESQFKGRLEKHNPFDGVREVTQMMRGCVDVNEITSVLANSDLPLQFYDNGIIHPAVHNLTECDQIHIYHLMPQGIDKGQALAADIERRGLKKLQTVAIGDAIGDVAMGRYTGSFVLTRASTDNALEVDAAKADAHIRPGFIAKGSTVDGWVEFARALLVAKGQQARW